jgi:hypothetical protein
MVHLGRILMLLYSVRGGYGTVYDICIPIFLVFEPNPSGRRLTTEISRIPAASIASLDWGISCMHTESSEQRTGSHCCSNHRKQVQILRGKWRGVKCRSSGYRGEGEIRNKNAETKIRMTNVS